jgi:1-acyl-sn-glycerol-3-phosphate acyltransferase/nucleoside-diphosphate-sugar epimerase
MTRVIVIAPTSIEAPLLERLGRRSTLEAVSGQIGTHADVLVYVPRGPGPKRGYEEIAAARSAFEAAARAGIRRAVIVSSGAVYGTSPYSPGFVDEGWLAPRTYSNAVADWWRDFERQTQLSLGDVALTILRPAAVLDGDTYFSRLFKRAVAVTLPGHDPSLQLLSIDDLTGAIERALDSPTTGVFNVAPNGVVPLRAALRIAGCRRIALPRIWQRAARAMLAPLGFAWPADHVEYIRYSGTISGLRAARDLGVTPTRSSTEALVEYRQGQCVPSPRAQQIERATSFDRFGQDRAYIEAYGRTLFTFLSRYYWRIETEGLDRVPASGRAVLVGPHRGFMPFDGVMLLHLVAQGRGRYIRFLIHPSLVKFPFLFNFMTKLGGVPACRENADWVLQRDEIAGVFPEGIHGAFTPYRDAYRLGKFGRDEFVRMALRNRAPIVPFATVGSAEIFPILAKIRWGWWERYTDWPYFPITPTFPIAPLPLPSKWHIRFLPPIHIEDQYPPEAADDPAIVREISRMVKERIQSAIDDMIRRRRWIFFGSIFDYGAV